LCVYIWLHVKDPAFPGHIIINKQTNKQINTGFVFFGDSKVYIYYIHIDQKERKREKRPKAKGPENAKGDKVWRNLSLRGGEISCVRRKELLFLREHRSRFSR
jgi:hypothetical protein